MLLGRIRLLFLHPIPLMPTWPLIDGSVPMGQTKRMGKAISPRGESRSIASQYLHSISVQGRAVSMIHSIAPDKFVRLVGTPKCPAVIDVRLEEDFAADPYMVSGTVRQSHTNVTEWASGFAGRSVVIICQKGLKLSQGVAAWLRLAGATAEVLEGGFEAWRAAKLPLVPVAKLPPRDALGRTVWVTRERPKIDRIACPWLIRRFVDPTAVFLFVGSTQVEAVAENFNAAPFDIERVFWSHRGAKCTFDVMIDELGLASDAFAARQSG